MKDGGGEEANVAVQRKEKVIPPWAQTPEEMTLKYTNGDEYQGFAIAADTDASAAAGAAPAQRHGFGKHVCKNGDFYEGEWREDVRHGRGKMIFSSGLTYDGEWANDKTWGEGVASYPNGDQYVGEWRQDHRWGWGLHKLANGDSFEGEWVDDYIHGKGRYEYKDGGYYGACISLSLSLSLFLFLFLFLPTCIGRATHERQSRAVPTRSQSHLFCIDDDTVD